MSTDIDNQVAHREKTRLFTRLHRLRGLPTRLRRPRGPYTRITSNELRLLEIQGKINGCIHCTLRTYPVDDTPAYTAISYTWGPPEDPAKMNTPLGAGFPTTMHTIKINGHDVDVKQNLYDLFQELLCECAGNFYWIDALCINQADEVEKAEQVRRMGGTYSNADSVLIWLGRAYASMSRVVSVMDQLYENFRPSEGVIDNLEAPEQLNRLGLEGTTTQDWYDLICFMKRTWFSRTWTMQELVLAKSADYRCGTFKLDAQTIAQISSWSFGAGLFYALGSIWRQYKSGEAFSGTSVACQADTVIRIASNATSGDQSVTNYISTWYDTIPAHLSTTAFLSSLLDFTLMFNCSDPRDKIFAVLGMAQVLLERSCMPPVGVVVDYSITAAELCVNTMSYLINGLKSLTLLSDVKSFRHQDVLGLPSWVKDFSQWSLEESSTPILDIDISHTLDPRHFNASKGSKLGFSIIGRALLAHHFVYGTVTTATDTWDEINLSPAFESAFHLFLARLEVVGEQQSSIDTLWKTMILDSTSLVCREYPEEDIRLGFRDTILLFNFLKWEAMRTTKTADEADNCSQMHYQNTLSSVDSTGTIPSPRESLLRYSELLVNPSLFDDTSSCLFQHMARQYIRNRRLILLDNGEIGVGHPNTKPGDEVCIIADGVKTPTVMRKVGTGDPEDRILIGDAYVKSIMFGEAIDRMEALGKKWEKIRIV